MRFLDSILVFPTAFLTALMGMMLTYWLFFALGAVGIDLLDGDEGPAEAVAPEGTGPLAVLGFEGIPLTISGSFVIAASWGVALVSRDAVFEWLGDGFPRAVLSSGLLGLSCCLGTLVAALAVRPLRSVLVAAKVPRGDSLMGRVCTIHSGNVTEFFGYATLERGGAGLILGVICPKANQLRSGDRALILAYEPERDVYEVEPVDALLPEDAAQIHDPKKGAVIAARTRSRGH